MDISTIKLGSTLLLKSKCKYDSSIYEKTLVIISDKAYKFSYHNDDNTSSYIWILKEEFDNEYEIVEIL